MVAYKIKKPQKDEGEKALDRAKVHTIGGLTGLMATLGLMAERTPESTPEERSNRKEKADRRDIPSFAETPSGYKKGGYVKSADGIAQRGKTKGRMC
jgi:hypothetical protein